jgi:CheY-like chemotaxis protein
MNTQNVPSNAPFITDYSGLTILIVDDEEYNLILLEEYLSDTGASILFAHDGYEAVNTCENNPDIDMIMMDIRMPVMNGFIAAQMIKSFRNIPIIAVSAFPYYLEQGQIDEAGFDDFMEKPFHQSDAFERINKHLKIPD